MRSLLLAVLVSAAPALAADWKDVSTEVFSAQLPGEPKVEDADVPTEAGNMKSRTWSVGGGKTYYAIAMVAYPPDLVHKSIPSKMLEGARDGAMANIQATLEKDFGVFIDSGIPKKKWPGREFSGSTPQGLHYVARIYLVDNELYQIILVRPLKEGDDEDFKKIVSSFKLKAPKKAAK